MRRKNLPVSSLVGSAVAIYLDGLLSTSFLIWVEVPAPSVPSKTMNFFNSIKSLYPGIKKNLVLKIYYIVTENFDIIVRLKWALYTNLGEFADTF